MKTFSEVQYQVTLLELWSILKSSEKKTFDDSKRILSRKEANGTSMLLGASSYGGVLAVYHC